MLKLILYRFGQAVVVLLFVSAIVFFLIRLTPGDPVDIFLGEQNVSPEQRQAYRRALGLDQSIFVQYLNFLWNAVQGDLGQSIYERASVSSLVFNAFLATAELAVVGVLIAVAMGVPAALVAAMNHNRLSDRFLSAGALLGFSIPTFWLGIILILGLSVHLGLFPTGGRIGGDVALQKITGFVILDSILTGNLRALGSGLLHIALPALTIAVALAASVMQVLRGSLIAVKEEEFIYALRSRGLTQDVIYRHMLRNAAPPTVIILGVKLGGLLGGAIITESVFSWPGLGRLIIDAIRARDYPLVQGGVLLMAMAFVIVSLITDIIHILLDPRIRDGREGK
ncbi:ABC transporter permease [Chelativorans composti]|jgi:ABC-type dipeptide/oligopeptide/nickel transport systems, permease components|uniref:ABC transporter permease n=1 Tax=Chelativorans composti TaxID=768533 RepID=A0ABW5DHP5_9HYPH